MESAEIRQMMQQFEGYWPELAETWRGREGYRTLFTDMIRRRKATTVAEAMKRYARSHNRWPTLDALDEAIEEVAQEERIFEARQDVNLPTVEQVVRHSDPQHREDDEAIAREALSMIYGLLDKTMTRTDVSVRCFQLADEMPHLSKYWINYGITVSPELGEQIRQTRTDECHVCGEMVVTDARGRVCVGCGSRQGS